MALHVISVDATSAAQSLVFAGDVIVSANGFPVADANALRSAMSSVLVGATVTLAVNRGGQQLSVQIPVPESRSLGLEVRAVGGASGFSSGPGLVAPTRFSASPVSTEADSTRRAAGVLHGLATTLFSLAILASLITLFAANDGYGGPNWALIGISLVNLLFWAWFWALSYAIAARLRLAAAVAQAGNSS